MNKKYILYITVLLLYVSLPIFSLQKSNMFINNDEDEVDTTQYTTICSDTLSAIWSQNICMQLEDLMKDNLLNTSLGAVVVYDLTADSLLFKHNELQLMRPASTQKLITAITALDVLGSNYEVSTELYYAGDVVDGVLLGDVYCKGGFDVMFKTSDLNNFIKALKEEGIDTIKGNLFADKSFKDTILLGEGWCWDDDNPILSPLLLNKKDNFIEIFRNKLIANGIFVEGENKNKKTPCYAKLVYKKTRYISDFLPRMMKNSDNLYAECVFYHLPKHSSQQSNSKLAKIEINNLIKKLGLSPSNYNIADGSGLSLYNYTTAELEIKFLIYAYKNEDIYNNLKPTLPIAGVDGTLSKRMTRSKAKGNVFAKTGTLEGVSSLAGYCVAANGHLLCFTIINNGLINTSRGRNFQNKVCDILCR